MKKNILITFTLLLSIAVCFLSCTTYSVITEDEYSMLFNKAEEILLNSEISDAKQIEKDIIRKSLLEFLLFTYSETDQEKKTGFRNISNLEQLKMFVKSELDSTPFELGYKAISYSNKKTVFDYSDSVILNICTEYFDINYYSNSKAENNIDMIGYFLEYYLTETLKFIENGNINTDNFYKNLSFSEKNRISILLAPDTEILNSDITDVSLSLSASTDDGTTKMTMIAAVKMPYTNILDLEVLSRSLTILTELLLRIEIDEKTVSSFTKEEEFETYFNSAVNFNLDFDCGLNKGFAEYLSGRYSLLNRFNLLFSPEERIDNIQNNIFKSRVRKKDNTDLPSQAESLIGFLIDNYSAEKFLKYYFSTGQSEDDFISIFNMNFSEAEDKWKEHYNL